MFPWKIGNRFTTFLKTEDEKMPSFWITTKIKSELFCSHEMKQKVLYYYFTKVYWVHFYTF